ncbi:MAG TPA: hypothetical protein VFY71_04820 [Planctomycetota bacterium]|nr:hypothetical protein [Planctomycetota bacterium]
MEVPWGERRNLIGDTRLEWLAFCNAVNGGSERETTVVELEVLNVEAHRCRVNMPHYREWSVPANLIVMSREPPAS